MANVHTAEQKEFIVRNIAAFCSPRDIISAFAARWTDTRCSDSDILGVDPRFAVLSPELFAAFKDERERVLADPDAAPYAKQQARLIALSHDVAFYRGNNQPAEARSVMRQIAEELGIGGKGGSKEPPTDPGEPVTEIVRTIVDPKEPNASGAETQHSDAASVRPVTDPAPV